MNPNNQTLGGNNGRERLQGPGADRNQHEILGGSGDGRGQARLAYAARPARGGGGGAGPGDHQRQGRGLPHQAQALVQIRGRTGAQERALAPNSSRTLRVQLAEERRSHRPSLSGAGSVGNPGHRFRVTEVRRISLPAACAGGRDEPQPPAILRSSREQRFRRPAGGIEVGGLDRWHERRTSLSHATMSSPDHPFRDDSKGEERPTPTAPRPISMRAGIPKNIRSCPYRGANWVSAPALCARSAAGEIDGG